MQLCTANLILGNKQFTIRVTNQSGLYGCSLDCPECCLLCNMVYVYVIITCLRFSNFSDLGNNRPTLPSQPHAVVSWSKCLTSVLGTLGAPCVERMQGRNTDDPAAVYFNLHAGDLHCGISQPCPGLPQVDSWIKVLIKHDKIRLASGVIYKHLQGEKWKTGLPDVIFFSFLFQSRFPTLSFPRNWTPQCTAGQGRENYKKKQNKTCWRKEKKKSVLVCGISVKQEIKSVHCLTERYARLSWSWVIVRTADLLLK